MFDGDDPELVDAGGDVACEPGEVMPAGVLVAVHGGLALRFEHLLDEDGVELGGHIGLDDAPLDDIAIIEHGGEGEDEDVLYGGADEGIAFLIQFGHEAHALAYHFEIVFEGHAFSVIR